MTDIQHDLQEMMCTEHVHYFNLSISLVEYLSSCIILADLNQFGMIEILMLIILQLPVIHGVEKYCPPLPISLNFWVELVGACNMGAHFQVCTTLVCLTNVNDMGK